MQRIKDMLDTSQAEKTLTGFFEGLGFNNIWSTLISAIVVLIICAIFIGILSNITETAHLTVVDHLLGFLLGLIEAFVMLAAIEYMMGFQNLFNLQHLFEESLFSSRLIMPFAEACASTIKGLI